MKKIGLIGILAACFILFGAVSCSTSKSEYMNAGDAYAVSENNNYVDEDTSRKIIYTVTYSFYSKDLEEVKTNIGSYVRNAGGYVESSSEEEDGTGQFVYRVPVEKLDEVLNQIDSQEGRSSKNVSSNDVTDSYVKTDEQIKVLEASREAYVTMLSKEDISISDLIAIQDKINQIDTELNSLRTLKNNYDSKISYSTINVYYGQKYVEKNEFQTYGQYWINFGRVVVDIIIYALPFAVLGGIVLTAILVPYNLKKKSKAKKAALMQQSTNTDKEDK